MKIRFDHRCVLLCLICLGLTACYTDQRQVREGKNAATTMSGPYTPLMATSCSGPECGVIAGIAAISALAQSEAPRNGENVAKDQIQILCQILDPDMNVPYPCSDVLITVSPAETPRVSESFRTRGNLITLVSLRPKQKYNINLTLPSCAQTQKLENILPGTITRVEFANWCAPKKSGPDS